MITVANPIYDIVFKYLIEDERIARTILSALLKKEVIAVETRRNEYSNIGRDNLSVFRIDFGATIQEPDGSKQLILIELQKTWLETETLRFRQYLGAQYANVENMLPENQGAYAIPMVTVYLLGHKVGDIEEPVLYVRRQSYNYNDEIVTKGLPNPFVDSLTHDSIIVQIPRLHGQVNNRLDKVLSIFDQNNKDVHNKQMLDIDESAYADDDEMMRIIHRLQAAAADAKMRHDMNVEDEYFSIIEKRDTTIMLNNQKIAEQNAQIAEQNAQIAEQSTKLAVQNAELEQKDAELEQKDAELEQKDAELEQKDAELEQKHAELEQKHAELEQKHAELEQKHAELEQKDAELEQKDAELEQKDAELEQKDAELEQKDAELEQKHAELEQKHAELEQKDAQIRISVQMLHQAGMSIENIAASLNIDIEAVRTMI